MAVDLFVSLFKFLIHFPIFGVMFVVTYFWIWEIVETTIYGLPKSIAGYCQRKYGAAIIFYYIKRSLIIFIIPFIVFAVIGYVMAWAIPDTLSFILNSWGMIGQLLATLYVIIAQLFFEGAKQARRKSFDTIVLKYGS